MLSNSAEETRNIGKAIGRELRCGDVVLLSGDLGAGKSELTRGIARGLGITGPVPSPSFTIMNVYTDGRIPLYHFDWYRLHSSDELFEMGLDEYISGDGAAVIEWPSVCPDAVPADFLEIKIDSAGECRREITLHPVGNFRQIHLNLENDQ